MKNHFTDPSMTEGRNLLALASEELNRANEDLVAYAVCHNTRQAITHFLNSFLVANGENAADESIGTLLHRCARLDGRFANFDLRPLACSCEKVNENDCYCFDAARLNACVQLAQRLEMLVSTQSPAY